MNLLKKILEILVIKKTIISIFFIKKLSNYNDKNYNNVKHSFTNKCCKYMDLKKKILQAKKWLILIITAKPSITRFMPLNRKRIHW
jgi:hypothetical protein